MRFRHQVKTPNGGVDAAARFHSSIAGPIMMRNAPPPLASNDLFGGYDSLPAVNDIARPPRRQESRKLRKNRMPPGSVQQIIRRTLIQPSVARPQHRSVG